MLQHCIVIEVMIILLIVFRMLLICLLQNILSLHRHHRILSWNISVLLMDASMHRMDQSILPPLNYSNRYICMLMDF